MTRIDLFWKSLVFGGITLLLTSVCAAQVSIDAGCLMFENNTEQSQDKEKEEKKEEKQPERRRREISWVNPKIPKMAGLSHHILTSKAMGHEVGYVVWLPKSYQDTEDKRYPVIYFLHGAGGNESSDSAGFSGFVSRGIRSGLTEEAICVFPNGGMSGYRGTVEKMIVEELVPLIDQRYRTISQREARAVAGYSMGGGGAVYLSLRHPELFAAAGSWGGGMFRGRELFLDAAKQNAEKLKKHKFEMLLVNGDGDRPEAYKALIEVLKPRGVKSKVEILPETRHNLGRYYQLHGEKMVRFLGDTLKRRKSEK